MPLSVFRLLCAALLLSGCTFWPWKHKPAPARPEPVPVGRVSLVNAEQRFALIESTMAQGLASGTVLRVYSAAGEVSAELRATGVKKRPFLIADLVSGMPGKGDLVVQPPANEETPRAIDAHPPGATPPPKARGWLGFLRFWK